MIIRFLLLFIYTVNALASYDPSYIKGQQDSSKSRASSFEVPNSQATQTGNDTYLIEGIGKELLSNPSFEHSTATTGWTTTGVTPSAETTTVIDGKKSLKFTASAQAWTLTQDSTLYQAQFSSGVPGRIKVRIKSNHTGAITICPRLAGTTLTVPCVTASASNNWNAPVYIPTILGATSNGVSISAASGTGDTYIDDVSFIPEFLSEQVGAVTRWQQYTPTFTGFGTVTVQTFWWRQNGANIDIMGRLTVQNNPGTVAQVTLPGSFTTLSTIPTLILVGQGARTVSTSQIVTVTAAPSVGYVTFGYANGGTPLGQNTSSTFLSGSEGFSFYASVPVNGLQASINTYVQPCTSDVDCSNEFTFTVAAGGTVSDDTLDFINGNCTNASPRVCTFNSGILTVAPSCTTDNDTIAAYTGTTSVSVSNNAATTKVTCYKSGADYKPRRNIVGSFEQFSYTAKIADVKADATDGGGFTSGAWQTRDLNTIVSDPYGLVTALSSNAFTLQPGRYLIRWSAPALAVDQHQSRLYNVTTSTSVSAGQKANSSSGSSGFSSSEGFTVVNINVATQFRIEHRCGTTKATNGYGSGTSTFGESSIYTQVEVQKLN